ncbi:MAG: hypothetical protein JOY61_08840, partial [Chloroflexi bacterium]|nr:hypothetical protein [Chloroflexota bacterium]
VPFRCQRPHVVLAAPLAGILVIILGIALLYSTLAVPVRTAGIVVVASAALVTALSVRSVGARPRLRQLGGLIVLAAALAAVTTWATCYASMVDNSPSLLFLYGTDQGGYAQTAEWLNRHPVSVQPLAEAHDPLTSWPAYEFQVDPRFGSFFGLAFISSIRGIPSLFQFDSATSILLSAGILAVCGVFSESPAGLIVLAVGLTFSHWYDYSRTGFLGKLAGYPSAMLLTGMFLALPQNTSLTALACILVVAAGAASVYIGAVAAGFLVLVGGTVVGLQFLSGIKCRSAREQSVNRLLVLAMAAGVSIATSGILARPLAIGYPNLNVGDWGSIIARALDLESQQFNVTTLSGDRLAIVVIALCACALFGLMLGVRQKKWNMVGLFLAPFLVITVLVVLDRPATALQLAGALYPVWLAASAGLLTTSMRMPELARRWSHSAIAALVAIGLIGTHVPHGYGNWVLYTGSAVPASARYSLADFTRLENSIGASPVVVDSDNLAQIESVLSVFGPEGLAIQWSPRSWSTAVPYRNWPPPEPSNAPGLWLVDASQPAMGEVIERTPQFLLVRRG